MDPATVARQGVEAVMAGTPTYVNGRVNRATVALFRYVPMSMIAALGRRIIQLSGRGQARRTA